MSTPPPLSPAQRLAHIADELRGLSSNGLQFTADPYQIARFQRILALAAELQSLVDARPLDDIQAIFSADLDYKTPLSVVDAAVLDPDGRLLLIRRADNGLWALPGGACDVGEAPATAAAREVWEETGYRVEITHLLGVLDSRLTGTRSSRHLYHLLFAGVPIGGEATLSSETLAVQWFELSDLPWSELSPGHSLRIQHALQWRLHPATPPYFDREAWQPAPQPDPA